MKGNREERKHRVRWEEESSWEQAREISGGLKRKKKEVTLILTGLFDFGEEAGGEGLSPSCERSLSIPSFHFFL